MLQEGHWEEEEDSKETDRLQTDRLIRTEFLSSPHAEASLLDGLIKCSNQLVTEKYTFSDKMV